MVHTLQGKSVLVIGGSSGIGLSVARLAAVAGAEVTISARDAVKLEKARASIAGKVSTYQADISDEASVTALFKNVGHVDHVAITGPAPGFGSFRDASIEVVKQDFEGKFWGQYRVALHAVRNGLPNDGSITFMSGAYSARPVAGASTLAAVQSAIEGLARGLAIDISPIRVNAISPGLTDTPLIRGIFGDSGAEAIYAQTAEGLPGKRIATSEDIAELYLFLMANKTMTGSTLFPDSGYTLR